MLTSSSSRADRRREARARRSQVHAEMKSTDLISRFKAAGKPQLASFVLLFWEGGDPASNSATIHFEEMRTRAATNILLLGLEKAVDEDIRVSLANGAPKGYEDAMRAFQADMKAALERCNAAVLKLPKVSRSQK